MKILCIGEALIDMICTDKGSPLAEGTHFVVKPGGAPGNVAAAIAAMGGKVQLAAKVGKDAFGQKLIATMQEFGVDTRWMLESPDHFTTIAFVSLMENGERDFLFNRGADGELTREETDAIELTGVSMIHFGSATAFLPGPLQDAYQNLLQKALDKKILVSFDPNYRHLLFQNNRQSFIDQSWHFLRASHFYKLSEEEAMLLTRTSSVNDAANLLLEKTNGIFAITLGEKGAMLGWNKSITIVPGIVVNAVDTTGAGDAFVGAMLYQLAGKNIQDIQSLGLEDWVVIITHANKTGAFVCEHIGAMEAFKQLPGKYRL